MLRRVWNKLNHESTRALGRLRAQLFGTNLSDSDFLRALESRYSTIESFFAHAVEREVPSFYLTPHSRQNLIGAVRSCCPEAETLVTAAADRTVDHIFDLLGSGPVHLGDTIDWHLDFKSGHRWNPQQYYAYVGPATYPGGYDIKVPWELSRCQYFVWLGQAYWFTEDEKYAQEFFAQITDWIESNPWPWGVNWTCTMDVAIRVVNWLWGYHFFRESGSLSDEFRLSFLKSLLVHGRHIFRNLENQGDFTGNHYLSNLVGLAYLGILCPEFKEAHQWREFGLRELEVEMFKQVYSDGVNFEASTAYHRLVTEMLLSTTILAQLNNHSFSQQYLDHLEKMVELIMYITKPDGTAPLIGDNDNGRLHRLKVWDPPEREWVDFRNLLAIGAVLFQREDFAQAAEDQWQDAIWVFGEEALRSKQTLGARMLPPLQLAYRSFPDAGLYVMRHEDMYLVVDAGPNGQNGKGGHAHNDALSFEFFAGGISWIVDPGSYVYTADYEARQLLRSTAYHNTPRVICPEPIEQNHCTAQQPFALEQDSVCDAEWRDLDKNVLALNAQLSNYGGKHITLNRIILLDRKSGGWLVEDRLSDCGNCRFELNLHLSEVQVHPIEMYPGSFLLIGGSSNLLLHCLTPSTTSTLSSGWLSRSYGIRSQSPVINYQSGTDLQSLTWGMILVESARSEDVVSGVSVLARLAAESECIGIRQYDG